MSRRLWISFLALVLCSGCTREETAHVMRRPAAQEGTPVERSGPEYQVVFTSDRDGNEEVYLVDPEDGELRNLTQHDADDWALHVADEILFGSTRIEAGELSGYQLFRLGRNETLPTRVTEFPIYRSNITSSPGGDRYVICSDYDGDTELLVIGRDGEILEQLTENDFEDRDPSWSPGGYRLALTSDRGGNWDLWLMNVDGTGARPLTHFGLEVPEDGHRIRSPRWSPHGDRILFASNRAGNFDLYTIRSNGSGLMNLTESEADEYSGSWSPDGQRVAFESDRSGNLDVYVMNADGTDVRALTTHPARDRSPMWLP